MFWISRLPDAENEVAKITSFTNLFWMLFAYNSLSGPGSGAIISRRYGEKDFQRTETAIKETIILKLFFGILFNLVGLLFLPDMLKLLGARGEAYELGLQYGRIMILGLPILYSVYSIFTALCCVANPKLAMTLMIGSNLLNVVLSPLLMFGWLGLPKWGIVAAAWATVISVAVMLTIGIRLFFINHVNVRLHLRGTAPISINSMWKMIWLSVPA